MRLDNESLKPLFLTIAALAFGACGGSTTGPAGGGGGSGGGEQPQLPEIPPAAQIFRDDLDSENGGVGEINYTLWSAWNVVEGCVDLHGPGSINPLPGNGVYIDMDGSCDDGSGTTAGTMETKQAFELVSGNYTLELLVAGNNQVAETDTMTVRIGSELVRQIVLTWTAPLVLMEYDFDVTVSTNETIEMIHEGGDDQGIIIDAIRLRRN